MKGHAESLITPLGAVQIVVAMKAPKFGFRAPLEFFNRQGLQYSLQTERLFPRPICT